MLITRNKEEVKAMKEAYLARYGCDLEFEVAKHTSGYYKSILDYLVRMHAPYKFYNGADPAYASSSKESATSQTR